MSRGILGAKELASVRPTIGEGGIAGSGSGSGSGSGGSPSGMAGEAAGAGGGVSWALKKALTACARSPPARRR